VAVGSGTDVGAGAVDVGWDGAATEDAVGVGAGAGSEHPIRANKKSNSAKNLFEKVIHRVSLKQKSVELMVDFLQLLGKHPQNRCHPPTPLV